MEKRDISPRCAVWAESSVVDKAHARPFTCAFAVKNDFQWEFADTEKMLKAGEDLMGEYIWGRYDMVVLPPTFPFGGIENPCLTYDESLVEQCSQLAKVWTTGTDEAVAQLPSEQFAKMESNMEVKVLDCIEQSPAMPHPRVETLEKKYAMATTRNCEVLFSWKLVALKAHWSPITPQALKFATSQGRMKYCKPIFRQVMML